MVNDDFTDNKVVDEDNNIDFFDSHDDAIDDAHNADDGSYSKGAPTTKKKRKKGATMKMGGKPKRKGGCQNTIVPPTRSIF